MILCVVFLSIGFEILAQRLAQPSEQVMTHEISQSSAATYIFHVVDISSGTPKILVSRSIEQKNIRFLAATRSSALLNDVLVVYSKDSDVFTTTLKNNGTIDEPSRVPLLVNAQSVLLYGYGGNYLCFMQGEKLFFNLFDSQFNGWRDLSPMSEILNGKITSVIKDHKGALTAYCDGEHINKFGDLNHSQNWMSYNGGVIYSMHSIDGGSSWSHPDITFKHNMLPLHNAMVVTILDESGEKSLAIMYEKLSNKVMYSVNYDDSGWRYPSFFMDDFEGKVFALYVTGSNVNVIYRHLSSIYQWKGTLENLERVGLYHGAKLIMRYSPDNERIVSIVHAGRRLLYIFTLRST